MKRVNIIARTNGVGLDRDVALIRATLLELGCEVSVSHSRRGRKWWQRYVSTAPAFDINIFVERVFPRWFGSAKRNFLMPNQERFPKRHIARLKHIDTVLCKTQAAMEAFAPHGAHCVKTGFYSSDMRDLNIEKQPVFLHLAGASQVKGTAEIVELWRQRPDYPPLTIVQHGETTRSEANISWRGEYCSEADILTLLNSHRYHLCPSQCEGWGHYIVEAMSSEALVLTTDAEPMNELVNQTRGCLVKAAHSAPRHLGRSYRISVQNLEAAVDHMLELVDTERDARTQRARQWFETLAPSFKKALAQACDINPEPQQHD